MMNIWGCLVLSAVLHISFVYSESICTDKELYHPFGPKITPCAKEIILQNGQNYTLKCQGDTFLKFVKQEGQEESDGIFTMINRTTVNENTEFKYEISLDLINVDLYAIGYYACIKTSVKKDLLNSLTTEPSNNENASFIYVYVNGTDSLFAPMLEMVTGKCDYYVVECRPSTPDVDVKLFMGDIPENTYMRYSPTIGFIFDRESIEALAEPFAMFTCCFMDQYGKKKDVERFYVKQRTDQPSPTIISDNKYFLEGETFHINCTNIYTFNGGMNIKWIFPPNVVEDDILSNQYDNVENNEMIYLNVTFRNVTKEHEGNYTCYTNGACGMKSTSTEKIFLTKPTLTLKRVYDSIKPKAKNFYSKTSLQKTNGFGLQVIDAYPPPKFSMYRDGTLLPNNETFSLTCIGNVQVPVCNFLLTMKSFEDFGNYTMSVTNDYETKNVTYELLFHVKPEIKEVTNHTCILNTKSSIACEVTGYPMPVVTWLFRNGIDPPIELESLSTTELSMYKMRAIVQIDCTTSGELVCMARNTHSDIHKGFKNQTRTVYVDEITDGFGIKYNETEATSIWVSEKDNVFLKCLGSRYKFNNVTWLLESLPSMKRNDNEQNINVISIPNKFSITEKLNINGIESHQKGIYTCRGIGIDGATKSASIQINVADLQEPVVLLNHNVIGLVEKNQKIELNCTATGVPLPSLLWIKDEKPLDKGKKIVYNEINRTTVYSSITIDHVKEENRGTYECFANSTMGLAGLKVVVNFMEGAQTPVHYIVIIAVIIVIFIILIIYLICRVRKEKRFRKELAAAGLLYFNEGVTKSINPEIGIDEQAELLPYDEKFEFPPDKLVYGKQLGAGAFGVVYKAEARGIINAEETTPVAVKMVKKTADNMYIKALASELKIMVHLGKHINIVNLLGACTKNVGKRELVVIVEYCKFGNIHNYMQRHREVFIDQFSDNNRENSFGKVNRGYDTTGSTGFQSDYDTANTLETVLTNNTNRTCRKNVRKQPKELDKVSEGYVLAQPEWRSNYESDYSFDGRTARPLTSRDLLAWAFQIARGMEYLAGRKVLHGDLAARNILLAEDNIVKICDFGLARSIYKNDEYQKKENSPLPVKWLAIECMTDRIFSTQSDVWSFGIVLWEMFSLAKTPYPNISPADLLRFLTDGKRLSKPAYSDDRIYELMKRCWEQKPTARPSFTQLQEILGSFLEDNVRSHYVDLNAIYMDLNLKTSEGQEDYLAMIRAPDYNNLVTPSPHHYVNETNQFFPPSPAKVDEEGYLQMSPVNSNNIFSPKPTNTKFDFDPRKFNSRPSEASNGGSELTPMLSLNNLQRSGSDSDHESSNPPHTNTCPKIDEESDEVFETKQFNEKNILNGAVTNPTYITLDVDIKKAPLDINNYVNIVPNGLVK